MISAIALVPFLSSSPSNDPSLNVVFDGNSLLAGVGATNGRIDKQLFQLPPLAGTDATGVNVAISGQTFREMDGLDGGSATDVDGAWAPGKLNILIVWEGSNSVFKTGRTGDEAVGDLQTYIAHRRSAHQWKIIVMTTLPRYQNDAAVSNQTGNNALLRFNDRVNLAPLLVGADEVCDVRQWGSPFDLPNWSYASFTRPATEPYWSLLDGDRRIHLNDDGYGVCAKYLARSLSRLLPKDILPLRR